MEWIRRAQDREQWPVFLNRAMEFWFLKQVVEFCEQINYGQLIAGVGAEDVSQWRRRIVNLRSSRGTIYHEIGY
jgi:hypothetical protein